MSKRALMNELIRDGVITETVGQGMLDNATTLIVEQQGAAVADVTGTAGGTYTATEQGVINENKAQINALLASLRASGLIAT